MLADLYYLFFEGYCRTIFADEYICLSIFRLIYSIIEEHLYAPIANTTIYPFKVRTVQIQQLL